MQEIKQARVEQQLSVLERGQGAAQLAHAQTTASAVLWPLYSITAAGFALAGLCFYWYAVVPEVALLLVGLVTFGMSFDFFNHVLGHWFPERRRFLELYARINFSALCFGIPFTAYAGSFVLAAGADGAVSELLVRNYRPVLYGSVAFGCLFLFARYKVADINGAIEFVLDKSHRFTRTIFLLRRALLAATLLIALTVLFDAIGTPWLLWALLFTVTFVATIPLHILHKQIPSMLGELVTQIIAVYGCWLVFVS